MKKSSAPSVRQTVRPSSSHAFKISASAHSNECKQLPSDGGTGRMVFNVLWGRISTKKHKTYENDGQLEINSSNSAILRDAKGSIIARTSEYKRSDFEEGMQIVIGAWDIQIGEIRETYNQSTTKRKLTECDISPGCAGPEQVKQKQRSPFKCPISSVSVAPVSVAVPSLKVELPRATIVSAKKEFKKVDAEHRVPKIEHDHTAIPTHSRATQDNNKCTPPSSKISFQPLDCPIPKYEELVLPSPPMEHQTVFNVAKKDVQEVRVADFLVKSLRPHQREGVVFLYECVMGYRKHTGRAGQWFGAILADEMGLGKTLQCLTLCYTLMKQGPYGSNIFRRILIVTPSSLVGNWNNEISKWLKKERIFTFIVDADHTPRHFASSYHIPFMIVSYEMFVKRFDEIVRIPFDVIICDEGHRLKNSSIKAATLLNKIDCKRRIVLTGTPIQNDLQEFYALVDFVNPGILDSYAKYKAYFEVPIVSSQQPDVLPCFRELGSKRAAELQTLTSTFVLRRNQSVIDQYLPDKSELLIFCKPSDLQQCLMQEAIDFYAYQSGNSETTPLQLITILKKICNHPCLVRTSETKSGLVQHLIDSMPTAGEMGPHDSVKMSIVGSLLVALIEQQEKIVLVSYSTKTLDIFQALCDNLDFNYCRIDGSTSVAERTRIVEDFNRPENDLFVFMLSAKAGGTGLNLIGASRLVVFDNDWNPAADIQAMSRIWRDGQTRDVYIYRLITAGTIEEKILQRQMSKTSLSGCIMNGTTKRNTLSNEDLKDLFQLQRNFDMCLTHAKLGCECSGEGKIPVDNSVRTPINDQQRSSLQVHELMQWEHYREPVDNELLSKAFLLESQSKITYLFKNQQKSLT